jgi:integrase/recombinase XerD
MAAPKGIKSVEWLRHRNEARRGGICRQAHAFDRSVPDALAVCCDAFLDSLTMHNYATGTIIGSRHSLNSFCSWAAGRNLYVASQITREILEDYQRWLWHRTKPNGERLGSSAQRNHLGHIKSLFHWLTRMSVIPHNPASEIQLPRTETRLPESVLTVQEVESLLAIPDTCDPLGIRNRTMLEVFYATGIRRAELCHLKLMDVNTGQKTLHIRLGKGRKDRFVPLGTRTVIWLERYLKETRPLLCWDPQEQALFVTCYGRAFNPDVVSKMVSSWLQQAGLKRKGCCHVLRHCCATHMLENGADIRFIQKLLGHAKLDTTAIYTTVSIKQLQDVHDRCHPVGDLHSSTGAKQDTQNPLPPTRGKT